MLMIDFRIRLNAYIPLIYCEISLKITLLQSLKMFIIIKILHISLLNVQILKQAIIYDFILQVKIGCDKYKLTNLC